MLKSKNQDDDPTNIIDAKAKKYEHNKGVQKSDKIPQIYGKVDSSKVNWNMTLNVSLCVVQILTRELNFIHKQNQLTLINELPHY